MSARIRLIAASAASISILLGAAAWFHFTETSDTVTPQPVITSGDNASAPDTATLELPTELELATNDVAAKDGSESDGSPSLPGDTASSATDNGASSDVGSVNQAVEGPLVQSPQD